MQIHITKNGQQLGPFDEEQLTELLHTGQISYDDLAWIEGMSDWQPLRTICAPPVGTPPPPPTSAFQAQAPISTMAGGTPTSDKRPTLWNPNAAALWSLFFSPAFGAFLHRRNALAIGRTKEAATNQKWFYVSLVCWVLYSLIAPLLQNTGLQLLICGVCLIVLLGWYFAIGRSQIAFVKEYYPAGYTKKGWLAPIGIGFFVIVGLGIANIAILGTPDNAASEKTSTTREQTADQTASSPQQKTIAQTETKLKPATPAKDEITSTLPRNARKDATSYEDLIETCSPEGVATMVQTLEAGKYYNFPQMYIADANNKLMLVYYSQTTFSGGIKSEDQKLCGVLTFPDENALANARLEVETLIRAVGKFVRFQEIPMNDGSKKRLPMFECPGIEIGGTYFKTK